MLPSVFGISGIRGIVGTDLTPETARFIGRGFGAFIGPGAVAVGRDARPSGEALEAAVVEGLRAAGCRVELLGICPTPTVLHRARAGSFRGAIVITASHNPEEWNGFKLVGGDGMFLAPGRVAEFRASIERDAVSAPAPPEPGTADRYGDAVRDHVEAVASNELFSDIPRQLAGRRIRVGVDAVNGAAAGAGQEIVRRLGAEPVGLFCSNDPGELRAGFPRRPEPTEENLVALGALVKREGLDFGVGFDPDGDRAGFVDETGTPLGEEATICLACRYVLARRPGKVVVNLSTTRAVEDVCADFSSPVERAPVGEAAVVERMKATGAVLGGEGNGGVILPAVNFTRDGIVATACVLGLVAAPGAGLSARRGELPAYRMRKVKLAFSRARLMERRARLEQEFAGTDRDERDGLRFAGPDYWVHIRASNTEPAVRVIAERKGGGSPDDLIERARRALE